MQMRNSTLIRRFKSYWKTSSSLSIMNALISISMKWPSSLETLISWAWKIWRLVWDVHENRCIIISSNWKHMILIRLSNCLQSTTNCSSDSLARWNSSSKRLIMMKLIELFPRLYRKDLPLCVRRLVMGNLESKIFNSFLRNSRVFCNKWSLCVLDRHLNTERPMAYLSHRFRN